MGMLETALDFAKKGFFVFPVIEGSKYPAIPAWQIKATRDPEQITTWWARRNFNIGISTSHFGEDQALVVVDVDNKKGKNGHDTVLQLELQGKEFPATLSQVTPTGGSHLIYSCPKAVKQGTDVLGLGLDIRSSGGYVVASGSTINGKVYTAKWAAIQMAPQWIVDKCGTPETKKPGNGSHAVSVDERNAFNRALDYIQREAPLALEGEGGDHATFAVAAKVKDFGVDAIDCLDLLFTYWNPRCVPPWSSEELAVKVENAYRYGINPQGADSPEAHFDSVITNSAIDTPKVIGPVGTLNQEYAYLAQNSEILRETTDYEGNQKLSYMSINDFHNYLLSKVIIDGNNKFHQLTKVWLRSPERRTYDETCFLPGKEAPPRFYNLWRGFDVEELTPGRASTAAKKSLENLLDHALKNICANDDSLFTWLMGYFAHLIQKPYEKPLTSVVMKGRKGTGKNVLIKCISRLIKQHCLLVANRRYLTGNFNGHLEKLLLLTLDEAFWSGDKGAEGILKDLVTGDTHLIERKGQEAYPVKNLTRVVIIGNEDWVVPATEDERRYAVFTVGDGRRKDIDFFGAIMDGMEEGGYSLLLNYLKTFDLSNAKVNIAPDTEGLLDQKHASLSPIQQWWFDAISSGSFENIVSDIEWPETIDCGTLRDSIQRYMRDRNIHTWAPTSQTIGRELRRLSPALVTKQTRDTNQNETRHRKYTLPTLEQARSDWEAYIGHKVKWDEISGS
jgi:hypothetical protein